MLNLNSILIGSSQPQVLGAFYEKVFGRPSEMPDMDNSPNNNSYGWLIANNVFFTIIPHSEVKNKAKEPQRIILNFSTEQVKKEYDRLISIGAISIREPYQIDNMWIATLADPDDNYFQLMTPWRG